MVGKGSGIDLVAADRYRSLFENSSDAILIIENDKFVDCNQAAIDMLGYKNRIALMQRHPSDLSPEYQPDGLRSLDKANQILSSIKSGGSRRFEWDHVRADGSILPVEVSMTAIPDEHGDGHTLNIVWRDLTECKRLEKELRHSQKMEALGSLAGGIAHDFNNSLGPIITYSELLSISLQDNPKLLQWAEEIGRAGMLAASMVKKLLAVSRQDDRVPVTLDLEASVANELEMVTKLIGEDIEVFFSQSYSELWVETDPGDIQQILLNLASNARDAMPKGGTIRISLSEVRQSNLPFARIEFTDDGMGMEEETLEQIFEPFFTTKELGSGTGLGMSSVYELVSKAYGRVNARSSPGIGTTIEVMFPIVSQPKSESIENADEKTGIVATSPKDAHILVIEDDVRMLNLICDSLDQGGYRTSTASNGINALALLESHIPDLILTDVIMPRMSGPEMVAKMHSRGIRTPVIFMSGYTDDRMTKQDFDATKVPLIRKPFTASELLRRVDETLKVNR